MVIHRRTLFFFIRKRQNSGIRLLTQRICLNRKPKNPSHREAIEEICLTRKLPHSDKGRASVTKERTENLISLNRLRKPLF